MLNNTITRSFFCLLLALAFIQNVIAADSPRPAFAIPAPPELKAKSHIVLEANTNALIAENNSDERLPPASMTKIMTSYLTNKAIHDNILTPDQLIKISEKAWRMTGSRMFIEVGTEVSVENLLKGVIIQSGNDASVALAEAIAGSEEAFANMMNAEAEYLGMKNSHFMNATGLPHPEHYSSARDMAILAQAVIRDFPESYALYKEKTFTYNNIKQINRNRLLWSDKSVDGLKTGHTDEAGFCMTASAKQGSMRLITVVFGSTSENNRVSDHKQLLAYGFRYYETHQLYAAAQPLQTPKVWMGQQTDVPVGLAQDLTITLPKGQYENLNASLQVQKTLKAPLEKGQDVGNLVISLDGDQLAKAKLYALESISQGGLWTRLSDYVQLKVSSWFDKGSNEAQA